MLNLISDSWTKTLKIKGLESGYACTYIWIIRYLECHNWHSGIWPKIDGVTDEFVFCSDWNISQLQHLDKRFLFYPNLNLIKTHPLEECRCSILSHQRSLDVIQINGMEWNLLLCDQMRRRERWEGTTNTWTNSQRENSGRASIERGMREGGWGSSWTKSLSWLMTGKIRGQVVFCSLKDLRQLATLLL